MNENARPRASRIAAIACMLAASACLASAAGARAAEMAQAVPDTAALDTRPGISPPVRVPADGAAEPRPDLHGAVTWWRVRDRALGSLADAHVAPGDRLALDVTCDERAVLYVLQEDATGRIVLRAGPRIAGAGESLRLPLAPPGRVAGWPLLGAGSDHETFLLLASRAPLAELERVVADAAAASARGGVPVDLSRRLPLELRHADGDDHPLEARPARVHLRDLWAHDVRDDASGEVWGRLLELHVTR